MPKSTPAPVLEETPQIEEEPIFDVYEEMEARLQAALSRIAELEEQQLRKDQLDQVLWLQRNAPNGKRQGVTPKGTPFISFGAQYGSLDKRSGTRVFGAWKNFTAYGPLAEAITEFFTTEDRLARITAYERPWHGQLAGADGPITTRNSEWVVVSFEPIARLDTPPVREPEAPFSAEPTTEEVPF